MRVLGIDYGSVYIGLAIGDSETKIASPIAVVPREGFELTLNKFIQEEGIDEIVIGVPISYKGVSKQEDETLSFIESVKLQTTVPIHMVDEKDTTLESKRLQDETGTKEGRDALAAMLILDDYFAS